METKLEAKIQRVETKLEQKIQGVETRLQGVETRLQRVETKVEGMETRLQGVETKLGEVNLTLENNLIPRLQNIETCYLDTYNRYISEIERVHALEADVSILKKVVQEHSEKLKEIS